MCNGLKQSSVRYSHPTTRLSRRALVDEPRPIFAHTWFHASRMKERTPASFYQPYTTPIGRVLDRFAEKVRRNVGVT